MAAKFHHCRICVRYFREGGPFFKTYNSEFDNIVKRFTDHSGRSLEIEDKIDMTLHIYE